MKKWIVSFLLAVAIAAAQGPESVEKLIELKHLEGDQADRAIRLVREVSDAKIAWDGVLKKIILKGPADRVAAAEKLLRSLDTPDMGEGNRRLEVSIWVIGGFSSVESAKGAPVPSDLDPVLKEMRSAFAYKAYTLIDTINFSTRLGGPARRDGRIASPASDGQAAHYYQTNFQRTEVDRDSKAILLRGFEFILRPPGNKPADGIISNDLLIRPGQRLVLGNIRITDGGALFLVISAKVD